MCVRFKFGASGNAELRLRWAQLVVKQEYVALPHPQPCLRRPWLAPDPSRPVSCSTLLQVGTRIRVRCGLPEVAGQDPLHRPRVPHAGQRLRVRSAWRVTARHTGRSVVGAGVDSCSSPCVLARFTTRSTVKALARDTFAETRDALHLCVAAAYCTPRVVPRCMWLTAVRAVVCVGHLCRVLAAAGRWWASWSACSLAPRSRAPLAPLRLAPTRP